MESNIHLTVSLSAGTLIGCIAIGYMLPFSRVQALERETCAIERHEEESRDWIAVTNLYKEFVSKLVAANTPFYGECQQPFLRWPGARG